MILLRRRKRAGLFLSLALVSKERKRERERERESLLYSQVEEFFFAGSETKARNERSSIESNSHHRVFKNHTSLRFKYSSSSSGHIKKLFNFTNSSTIQFFKTPSKSSSSESSSLAWCAKKLFFCLLIRRERENVVGDFVEEKRFTLNAAAKTTKLELGVLSFCLLSIISSTSSLSNPNAGGEDDERGSSSSTSSARTVSRVSANAFYGSEYE